MQNRKDKKIPPPFRTNMPPGKPYYFVRASLNISEILPLDENTPFELLLYFNRENNFNYLSYSETDLTAYPHYWTFTKNSGVIEDVLLYSFPSINQSDTLQNITLNSIRAGLFGPPGTYITFEDQWTGLTGVPATNIINSLNLTELDFRSQKRSLGRCPRIINPDNKYLGLYLQGFTGPEKMSKRNSIFIHILVKVYQKNT